MAPQPTVVLAARFPGAVCESATYTRHILREQTLEVDTRSELNNVRKCLEAAISLVAMYLIAIAVASKAAIIVQVPMIVASLAAVVVYVAYVAINVTDIAIIVADIAIVVACVAIVVGSLAAVIISVTIVVASVAAPVMVSVAVVVTTVTAGAKFNYFVGHGDRLASHQSAGFLRNDLVLE